MGKTTGSIVVVANAGAYMRFRAEGLAPDEAAQRAAEETPSGEEDTYLKFSTADAKPSTEREPAASLPKIVGTNGTDEATSGSQHEGTSDAGRPGPVPQPEERGKSLPVAKEPLAVSSKAAGPKAKSAPKTRARARTTAKRAAKPKRETRQTTKARTSAKSPRRVKASPRKPGNVSARKASAKLTGRKKAAAKRR